MVSISWLPCTTRFLSYLMLFLAAESTLAEQTINPNIPNNWPDSRYIVSNDTFGTVIDTKTGLMWKPCVEGTKLLEGVCKVNDGVDRSLGMTLAEALQFAEVERYAAYANWRVPNVKELITLIAYDRNDRWINLNVFPHLDRYSITSSTRTGYSYNSISKWFTVATHDGSVEINYINLRSVLLVRTLTPSEIRDIK